MQTEAAATNHSSQLAVTWSDRVSLADAFGSAEAGRPPILRFSFENDGWNLRSLKDSPEELLEVIHQA